MPTLDQEKISKFKRQVKQFESELELLTTEHDRRLLRNKINWRKLDVSHKQINAGLPPSYRLYDDQTTDEKQKTITQFKKEIRQLSKYAGSSISVQVHMRRKKLTVLEYELNHPHEKSQANNAPVEPLDLDLEDQKILNAAKILVEVYDYCKTHPGILNYYKISSNKATNIPEPEPQQPTTRESLSRKLSFRNTKGSAG